MNGFISDSHDEYGVLGTLKTHLRALTYQTEKSPLSPKSFTISSRTGWPGQARPRRSSEFPVWPMTASCALAAALDAILAERRNRSARGRFPRTRWRMLPADRSQETPRWREMDSNPSVPRKAPGVVGCRCIDRHLDDTAARVSPFNGASLPSSRRGWTTGRARPSTNPDRRSGSG